MALKWIALTSAVVLVFGGWTGAWFYVRSEVDAGVDRALADLAAGGVAVDCPERSLDGWPFRITLACRSPSLRLADGTSVAADGLRAVTDVSDVGLIIVELDPPLRIAAATGEVVDARFTLLQSSIRHGDGDLERLSLAIDGLDLDVGMDGAPVGGLAAGRAEFHLLAVEADAADRQVSVSLSAAVPKLAGAEILPAPVDAAVFATVDQAAALIAPGDPLRSFAAAGGGVDLHRASVALGGASFSADGRATLDASGALDAKLATTATGLDWLTTAAKEGKRVPPILSSLGSAFLLLGRPAPDSGRRIDLLVEDGTASANGLAIGTVPPLF